MKLNSHLTKLSFKLYDYQRYISKNYEGQVQRDLLYVIRQAHTRIHNIKDLLKQDRYVECFCKIAESVTPRKKDFYIRRNYDYGEFWPAVLDAFEKGEVENVVELARKLRRWPQKDEDKYDKTASTEALFHLDSYCDSEKNKQYWKQMLQEDEDYNQAVEDFIKYIEEGTC